MTRTVTNTAGAVQGTLTAMAFRQSVSSSGSSTDPHGFAATSGHRSDGGAGLTLVGARYYDAQAGAFISRDTYLDQLPYGYCDADPVSAVDPDGYKPVEQTGVPYPFSGDTETDMGGSGGVDVSVFKLDGSVESRTDLGGSYRAASSSLAAENAMAQTTLLATLSATVTLLVSTLTSAAGAGVSPSVGGEKPLNRSSAKTALLRAYAEYVHIINRDGTMGLSGLTLPGFRLRIGDHSWQGQAALRELDRYDHPLPPNNPEWASRFGVTLIRVHIGREWATADVQESQVVTWRTTPVPPAYINTAVSDQFRQERWRKTTGGWRLAEIKFVLTPTKTAPPLEQTGVPYPFPGDTETDMGGSGGVDAEVFKLDASVVSRTNLVQVWKYRVPLHDRRILAKKGYDSFLAYVIKLEADPPPPNGILK